MRISKTLLLLFVLMFMVAAIAGCNTISQNSKNDDTPTQLPETEEPAEPTEPIETSEPVEYVGEGVTLNYFGRASVRLDFYDGRVIYIDPAYGGHAHYAPEADIVLVTHQHYDHNNVDLVTLKEDGIIIECPYDMRSGEMAEVDDIKIEAVDAYNSNHSKSSSCGFIITWGDLVLYHSGDTSTTTQMEDFPDYEIDYAMLCMDGYYNMGPDEAEEVSDLIEAQAVIPIHTSPEGAYDLDIAQQFDHSFRIIVTIGESLDLYDLSETDGVAVPFDQAIIDIMDDRLAAIENEDYDSYMSVITTNNQFLFNEQERWFMNMIDEGIHDLSFEIVSTQMIDNYTGVATIKQKHQHEESFDIEYPLLFKYEDGMWMDHGYNFEVLKTDRFTVKYMEDEQRVEEFVQMLEDAFDNLASIYKEKPWDDYEMKLFTDQEMLRQRTIPANLWLFTGWSEPDESLKVYTGHPEGYKGYPGLVQHELVHHVTINICNNNLPGWLLEGIAMYDGSAFYGFENSRLLSRITKENVSLSINHIEENDLTTITETQRIYDFYATSYMYVRYICETYGRQALMDIFYEAGKKPFHDSTLNETFELENHKTAEEVIMTVLGLTKAELSEGYLEWLDTLDFENLG